MAFQDFSKSSRMEKASVKYSIVVPVFNAIATLEKLINDIEQFVAPMGTFEIVLVDDCSNDTSWALLKKLKTGRSFMKIYRLSNNFGQAAATLCGIYRTTGETIIMIDDDLQYPVWEIPRMIRFFNEHDHYMVLGIAQKKQHSRRHLWAQKLVRFLFWLRPSGHLNGKNISSSFRIVSAELKHSSSYSNPGLRSIHLANQLLDPRFVGVLNVEHRPNPIVKKKGYSFRKRLENFTDILMVFNKNPLNWLLWPIVLLTLGSSIGGAITLFSNQEAEQGQILLYLLLGISAITLFCIMIMGKYLGHIYAIKLGMPPYFVIESHE